MDHEITLRSENVAAFSNQDRDSDADMARDISAGDSDAWDRFFDRFSEWAYRFAYFHLNRNKADAEDLSSDILLTAARSIAKYDATRGTLDLWLLGVARHRLAHFCRRRSMDLPLIPDVVDSQQCTADFDTLTDDIATRDAINRALASLPERQAVVLVDKYVNGYSTEEIARIRETTPKAVESLLSRARSSLRSSLCELLNIAGRRR